MTLDAKPKIAVFYGNPLKELSEIQFLDTLRKDLLERQEDTLIFANFFAGRLKLQIDFVIITSNCACVVELKNYNVSVFGQINGPWELREANGTLINQLGERNPYHQAREAKYAISDEMHSFLNKHPELKNPTGNKRYFTTIESVVCIFPEVPSGSQITSGDYKTYVKGYSEFLQFVFSSTTNPGWTNDIWLEFAMELGLRQKIVADAAHPKKREAIQQSEAYIGRFLDFYTRNLNKLAETQMTTKGEPCKLESLESLLRLNKNFQLIGPSGSGKTHLIKHLSVKAISAGFAPVFVPGKYFSERLSDLLDRSVAPLHPGNAGQLFRILSASGKKPFLIIDGVNECPVRKLGSLIETLQAFVLRYKLSIIFTSQSELDLPSALSGMIFRLNYLTNEEKLKVAAIYLTKPESRIGIMLDALRTPFEISLAIQSALEAGRYITKYILFNSYSRKCLDRGQDGSLAFRILVKIAQIMSERLSTTMPLAEFKRVAESITEKVHAKPEAIATILESGLIELQHGDSAFSHEMIQWFFEAEAILSNYVYGDALFIEMEKPRNHHLADFVLGAQAETESAKKLLRLKNFQNLLSESIEGHFGRHVKKVIYHDIDELFEKANKELREIDLAFEPGKGPFRRNIQLNNLFSWTAYERALMVVIGKAFMNGIFIDPVLKLIQETDHTCFKILDGKGFSEDAKTKLRNDLFPMLFVWTSDKSLPVSTILSEILISQIWYVPEKKSKLTNLTQLLLINYDKKSFGTLYLMCELIRRLGNSLLFREIPGLLQYCWDTGIYHLRLHALEAINVVINHCSDSLRSDLIDIIEGLDHEGDLALSTTIIEILSGTGAIEIGMTVEDARNEIYRLLYPTSDTDKEIKQLMEAEQEWIDTIKPSLTERLPENPEEFSNRWAYTIYSKIFEEVFQGIYYEAIEQLSKDELTRFMTMAALGAPSYAFFVDTLLNRLLKIEDPRTFPAFERWAAIPGSEYANVQDSIKSFLLAIIGLGRYTEEPPRLMRPMRDDEAAWQFYREILFWLHKPSVGEETIRSKCSSCWHNLLNRYSHAAVDPLMRIQEEIRGGMSARLGFYKDLITFFGSEVRSILESGIKIESELTCIFGDHQYFKEKHARFMIETLEEIGDESSIPLLEKLIERSDIGQAAINAIRSIRARTVR